MLTMVQQQIQGLECSVCGQIVYPQNVAVCSLLGLLARLKLERYALCPSCTQEVSPELQSDAEYQARWTPFVREMVRDFNRGVRWYSFKPTTER